MTLKRCRLEFDLDPCGYMRYVHTPSEIAKNFGMGYNTDESKGQVWVEVAFQRFIKRCRRTPPTYERLANLHRVLIARDTGLLEWPAPAAIDQVSAALLGSPLGSSIAG